jgi:hypothetical protein
VRFISNSCATGAFTDLVPRESKPIFFETTGNLVSPEKEKQ